MRSFSKRFAGKPEILQDPNDLDVVFGSSAVFKCTADGDPTPEIKWMLNSNDIDSSDSRFRVSVDGTLQIDKIDTRDQGVCIVLVVIAVDVMAGETIMHNQ